MGGFLFKAMVGSRVSKDIPWLTEYLANNKTFIKYSLKVNRSANSNLTWFQKYLHEAAFPDGDEPIIPKKDANIRLEKKDKDNWWEK
jgi:hypothetical protein